MTVNTKVLLIGFGRFGQILYKKLSQIALVVGIVNRGSEIGLKTPHFSDYKDVDVDYDVVVIATPPASHVKIARYFLQKNKNVFIEKPLAFSEEDAFSLTALAENHAAQVCADTVFLYRPEWSVFKSAGPFDRLVFSWEKYGTFDDSIVDTIVYHDLYLLADLLECEALDVLDFEYGKNLSEGGRIDALYFQALAHGVHVEAFYDRYSSARRKSVTGYKNGRIIASWENDKIYVNGKEVFYDSKDAIESMFLDVFFQVSNKKNIDISLFAVRYLQYLKERML